MQRADANGVVMGDDFVVFAAKLGGHAEMGAFLAGDRVAELAQRLHQSVRRDIAGQISWAPGFSAPGLRRGQNAVG